MMGLLASVAYAQTTSSSISGTVMDPSGAVVPNAAITATNTANGQISNANSDGRGAYTITNIPPGSYTVAAKAKGFQPVTQSNVAVDPSIGRQVNFTLKVGSDSAQTIEVEADTNALQTESASVGQLVTTEQVKGIQLNGRNPIYLSQLEPGVTRNAPLTSFNFTPDFGGPQISGARNDEISVTLDGAPMIRTRGNGTTTGVADVDSVSQMQILSTAYPAQYGGTSGGILAQVAKSGTSQFHGSAYEYLRNSFFNANTWIRNQSTDPEQAGHPTPFRFNQFGWNLNGPLAIPHVASGLRDKLFFLVGQEYLRYRQSPTQTGTVPSALMRTGNFSELETASLFGPAVQLKDPATGADYPDNVITAGLSPNGLALLNAYPTPNENQSSYNWSESAAYPQNQRKDTVTVDYLPTDKQQLRFALLHYTYFQDNPFAGNFNRTPQIWHWPDEVGVLHWTWTLKPTLVNDLTASASTDHVTITDDLSSGLYDRTTYGINFPYLFPAADKLIPNKIPTINISNFTTLDGGPYPSHSGGIVYTVADTVTKVKGNHTLVFGGLWMYSGENNFDQIDVSSSTPGATNNQNGQFIFTALHNGQSSTGAGVANAALGLFDSYGEIGQKSYTLLRANAAEFFAQDSWHATPSLLIEAGARYSIFQPYYALWRNQSMFNPTYYDASQAPTVDPTTGTETGGNIYDGIVIPGSGFPGAAKGHVPDSLLNGSVNNLFHGSPSYSPIVWSTIQPRFGLTWQVGPHSVFRAGGGRYIQRLGISDAVQLGGNEPFQAAESVTNGSADNPGGVGANQYPLQLSSQSYHFPSPESWAWNATFEQEIPKFATFTLTYVGRKGLHLQQLENINELPAGTTFAHPDVNSPDALRTYQGFASIIEQSDRGSSIYNGMQVNLKRRLSKNFLFGVAYTWSKLLDFGSGKGYELPDFRNRDMNYGPADFDIRNVLVVDYVWNLPYAQHASNWLIRNALGDWQVSGVTQAQTGEPFSVSDGNDYAGVGPGAGQQIWAARTKVHMSRKFGSAGWFDTSAFENPDGSPAHPADGTFSGRGSRNQWYNPGFQSWNIAAQKPFHIVPGHDSQQLIFRAEAFNFTNHPNLDNSGNASGMTTPGSANFGMITTKGQSYSSDRELQFNLRYQF
ncbi:MAG TPA: carboxypeptidase regulatory-like domain-containing protein [Acidobacteriaceae bacterium]|nr:carboxypeptidase regulatory-like domain-containing protein [Acidobacteriaceae bacterium]